MESLTQARTFLQGAQDGEGALGHLPGQPAHLEPTLLAVAAGAVAAPLGWLARQPWNWGKLLLPAVLAGETAEAARAQVREAVAAILALQGEKVEQNRERLPFDATIAAWPWVAGTASWVEPTAYALLSLKRSGHGGHPRVAQGEALLRDRQCADGGWNYGNPRVLGATLESDLCSTGWAVMALPGGQPVQQALARLSAAAQQRSTSTLSLAILAHRAHHQTPDPALLDLLLARQRGDGSFGGRCDWTALAACALAVSSGAPHPFGVPA